MFANRKEFVAFASLFASTLPHSSNHTPEARAEFAKKVAEALADQNGFPTYDAGAAPLTSADLDAAKAEIAATVEKSAALALALSDAKARVDALTQDVASKEKSIQELMDMASASSDKNAALRVQVAELEKHLEEATAPPAPVAPVIDPKATAPKV